MLRDTSIEYRNTLAHISLCACKSTVDKKVHWPSLLPKKKLGVVTCILRVIVILRFLTVYIIVIQFTLNGILRIVVQKSDFKFCIGFYRNYIQLWILANDFFDPVYSYIVILVGTGSFRLRLWIASPANMGRNRHQQQHQRPHIHQTRPYIPLRLCVSA